MAIDELGPAFDSATIIRPTQRKIVGRWMENAGLPTLIVPQVWRELTRPMPYTEGVTPVDAWLWMEKQPNAPFLRPSLTQSEIDIARDIRSRFTQACFPKTAPDMIETLGDAFVISEAVALGTDALVTNDIRTIDHYEVNHVVGQFLGHNAPFVTTLDNALLSAHEGGQSSRNLLVLALSTIAPPVQQEWPVDDAYDDLSRLTQAMIGAYLGNTAMRLMTRWECTLDLPCVLEEAQLGADQSCALQFENRRTAWLRSETRKASKGPDIGR